MCAELKITGFRNPVLPHAKLHLTIQRSRKGSVYYHADASPSTLAGSISGVERSSLYRAMQQQAFYFISRKYVHDVQQVCPS
ncbi:hypothetical protein NQ318_000303 [Aromia moschata]|uniref:Uncharacterized protein n=1 Tax=Aromia moschata TaxID=1265417 RepID=A0AAV8YWB0_9CUCU|nr:hypothetical protein NQ318_000303 [Aromia moschata]